VAAVLLLVVVTGSALSLGSLQTVWLCVWTLVTAGITVTLYWGAAPLALRPAARVLLITLVGLTAYTALTLLPLPMGVLARLAPENADVWSRALLPLHEPAPSYAPLSLDPSATRVQVLRSLFYGLVFLSGLRLAASRQGTRFLERSLVLASVVMALAALAHPATGATRVFGSYEPLEPSMYGQNHIAPLLNGNHLAAFVNIGFLVAVSSLLRPRHPTMPPALAGGAAALLIGTSVFTSSRGGVAAAGVALVATLVLAFVSRQTPRRTLIVSGVLLVMGLGGAVMATLAFSNEYLEKMAGGDFSKLGLFANAMKLVWKTPIFGVGRGAFESTFPSVRERMGLDYFVFTHPENLLVQWCSEWGIPVALLALGAMIYALRPKTVLGRSLPPIGAWAALVMALLHNMVDFNAEVPGVMCALSLCAAICVAGTADTSKQGKNRRLSSAAPLVLAGAALIVGAWAFVARDGELGPDQRALRTLVLQRTTDKDGFHAAARAAMLRHPAEAFLPYLGELRASGARDESLIPWAGRALERSPVFGRAHLLLARSMFARPGQARLEYKLASAQDTSLRNYVAEEGTPLIRSYEDAMELVPDGPGGVFLLGQLSDRLRVVLPATSVRLDQEILRRDANSLEPLKHAVAADLHDIREGEAWCTFDRDLCVKDAMLRAEHLVGVAPERCETWDLRSQVFLAKGDPKRAIEDLTSALDKVNDRTECAKAVLRLSVQVGQSVYVEQAVERLSKVGCTTNEECQASMVYIAEIERQTHNDRRAIFYYKRALEMNATETSYLVQIAQIAEQNNMHGEAALAYGKLATAQPQDARWSAKKDEHERAVRDTALENLTAPKP
jgi:O-antigen ligase/tetratricopeptide (TPR) repeat protein